ELRLAAGFARTLRVPQAPGRSPFRLPAAPAALHHGEYRDISLHIEILQGKEATCIAWRTMAAGRVVAAPTIPVFTGHTTGTAAGVDRPREAAASAAGGAGRVAAMCA